MKKTILALSLFFNAIIILSSFTENNSNKNIVDKSEADSIQLRGPADKSIGFKNIISSEEAKHYKAFYESHFRAWYKKVPQSIWFTREVYEYLGDFFKNDSIKEYDGIRIFFVQYDEKGVAPGAEKNKRISICMVPTKQKKEDWDAITENKVRDYLKNKGTKEVDAALNHGEICPQKCIY